MSAIHRNVVPFVAFLGLALLPVVSQADDGGGDYAFPASNVVHEPLPHSGPLTCAEAKRAAFFQRQVEISDGDVSPTVALPAECDRKVFAQASDDKSGE
jgi:hypothetical protein